MRHRRWIVNPDPSPSSARCFSFTWCRRATPGSKVLWKFAELLQRPGQRGTTRPPKSDESGGGEPVQVVLSRELGRETVRRLRLVGQSRVRSVVTASARWRRLLILLGLARKPYDFPPENAASTSFTIVSSSTRSASRASSPSSSARAIRTWRRSEPTTVADLYLALRKRPRRTLAGQLDLARPGH